MPTWPAQMYPDQSLYPANSVPAVVRAINNALHARRSDPPCGGREWHELVRADRGGCRGRLWRPAECLRTDEGA